jgi:hypothetical protein
MKLFDLFDIHDFKKFIIGISEYKLFNLLGNSDILEIDVALKQLMLQQFLINDNQFKLK